MYVCMCVYICIYVYMYVYIYVYMYIQEGEKELLAQRALVWRSPPPVLRR